MRIVAGILSLVSGVVFPMGMLFWLNRRFGRSPTLRPIQVGLLLALNGVLPVALVTLGLALMSDKMWTSALLRTATGAAWVATMLIVAALAVVRIVGSRGARDV